MAKERIKVSADLRRLLIIECGNKCSMPNCNHETGLEIHHIDNNPANNSFENLLILCAIHHSQVTKKVLDRKTCTILKRGLQNSSNYVIMSRLEMTKYSIQQLKKTTTSFRNYSIGPIFLFPEYYFFQRNKNRSIPSFDLQLKNYIEENCYDRNHDVRFIFSLSEMLLAKIKSNIPDTLLQNFSNDVLEALNIYFGANGEKGPDICCTNMGFSAIDLIFDDSVVSTFRSSKNIHTKQFTLYTSSSQTELSRNKFDELFDTNSKGQITELQKLKSYFESLNS